MNKQRNVSAEPQTAHAEQQTAYAIARQLDQSIDQLPQRVTDRLQQARESAMAAYPKQTARQLGPKRSSKWLDFDTPSLLSRAALAVVPLTIVTAGLIGLSQWTEDRRSFELAELDTQVVLSDLPLAALTDQGFGVFLENTRQ